MEKYCCNKCGAVFEDAEYKRETYGEDTEFFMWEMVAICPECGSDDLSDALKCPVCGEWHDPEDGDICSDCKKDITALWLDLLSNLPDVADECEVARYISEVLV